MSAAQRIEELEQRVEELETDKLLRETVGAPVASAWAAEWEREPEPDAPAEPLTEEQLAALRLEALQRKYIKPLAREVERLKQAVEIERGVQAQLNFAGAEWPLERLEQKLEAAEAKLATVRALDLPAMAARIAEHETLNDPKVLAGRIGETVEKYMLSTKLRREVYEEMERHRAQLHSDLCELANLQAQLDGLPKATSYVNVSHRVRYAFDLIGPVTAQLDAQLPSEPGHTSAGEALRAKRNFALGLTNVL